MLKKGMEDPALFEIGSQIEGSISQVEVELRGNKVELDYCIIRASRHGSTGTPVVLLTGFGSGWRGIAELGFYLRSLGRDVVFVSLPGYGNSGNLPLEAYSKLGFITEACVLALFTEKVLEGRKAHWVGHSMGAQEITEFACSHPEYVASLTLLNPSGFEKLRSGLWLALKFSLCGMMHRLTSRGPSAWEKLQIYLPKEESAFTKDRIPLRRLELRRLKKGNGNMSLRQVSPDIPVAYISGEKDFVVPYKKATILNDPYLRRKIWLILILPLWHNTTMLCGDITAKAIEDFLRGIE